MVLINTEVTKHCQRCCERKNWTAELLLRLEGYTTGAENKNSKQKRNTGQQNQEKTN